MKYQVWIEEYDGENEWRSVGDFHSAESAAEAAAEHYDSAGDYTLREGETCIVHVKREDGVQSKFKCRAEQTVDYFSEAIIPEPEVPCDIPY